MRVDGCSSSCSCIPVSCLVLLVVDSEISTGSTTLANEEVCSLQWSSLSLYLSLYPLLYISPISPLSPHASFLLLSPLYALQLSLTRTNYTFDDGNITSIPPAHASSHSQGQLARLRCASARVLLASLSLFRRSCSSPVVRRRRRRQTKAGKNKTRR